MKAMGIELHEMKNHGGFSFCCGGGGGVLDIERAAPLRYRTMENKLREIDDTGAETFVTSCSDCRRTFDDAQAHFSWNKTPHSLLELVAEQPDGGRKPNMSAQTIVVDPVTRIEGHLRIEAEYDGSVITRASSSGTMVRGIEIILQGRDPRDAWAFAQRICGVCTLVHGIASVRAVEDALKITIPANAQLIRNLMIGAQFVHDHVMHFYHLHALDWVDVVSALKADPKATSALAQSISSYARSSPGYFADVQRRVKKLVESGQLGIFANAYWGNPLYKLPPEANLMAVAHYLDALAWQRQVAQLHTIFGGKNPHPNFLVGGAPSAISVHSGAGTGSTAVNAVGLQQVAQIIEQMRNFVDQVYVPDTLAIASFYKDWFKTGEGIGNFMTYGDFPATGSPDPKTLPGAARRHSESRSVAHRGGRRPQRRGRHPGIRGAFLVRLQRRQGDGLASLQGRDPIELLGTTAAVRASGYLGQLFLAQVAALEGPRHGGRTAGARAHAVCQRSRTHEGACRKRRSPNWTCRWRRCFRPWGARPRARSSARSSPMRCRSGTRASWRTSRPAMCAPSTRLCGSLRRGRAMRRAWDSWRRLAAPWRIGSSSTTARSPTIRRWCRAPGTPARAMRPATEGPYEAALKGQSVQDPKQPLEILRTIHSFDPCLACAVHVVDPDGEELIQIRVQ